MSLPDKFIKLVNIFNKLKKFKNILIVNSSTTGLFLDKLLNTKKTIRIKYLHNVPGNYETFVNRLKNIDTKFDLICVDPHHEYKESIETFNLIIPLLNDNGILISHDCNPPTYTFAHPYYTPGMWCGVTYAAFVEIAYNNPDWYYAVIDRDYGLGILSKKPVKYVKQIADRDKQTIFLDLFKENKYEEAYEYFKKHTTDIINLIT